MPGQLAEKWSEGKAVDWLPWYHQPTRSAKAPGGHVLVYDGDCGFCRASAAFIQRRARTSVTLITFAELEQEQMLTALDWPQVLRSAHYITPEGNEYHGGESIIRALRLLPGGAVFAVFQLWGLALIRELVYGLVANNRPFFSWLTSLFLRGKAAVSCSTGRPKQD